MFELTLSLDLDRQNYINDFYKLIMPEIKNNDGIIIKQNYHGKSYLALAVDDNKKEYLKSRVLDFVCSVVIEEFKSKFFKSIIQVDKQNEITEAFFKAISLFDFEIDKEIISSNIEFKNEIVIESLYYFKLQNLKVRWEKTAKIINQNGIMMDSNSMIEVIRYLCNSSDNNTVVADIFVTRKQIELKSYIKQRRFKLNFGGLSDLYTEIVSLNPMKINLKNNGRNDIFDEISSVLLKVFEDKIYLM